jgi:hypothetical protein
MMARCRRTRAFRKLSEPRILPLVCRTRFFHRTGWIESWLVVPCSFLPGSIYSTGVGPYFACPNFQPFQIDGKHNSSN